jgi:hypothetical protein
MTPINDLPSAAEALRIAFDIVKTPCSAAEAQRAEVLLGIARELRAGTQTRVPHLPRLHRLVPAAETASPADPEATAVVPLGYGQRYQDDPAVTQRIKLPWQVGDKADCRHCHTPIQLDEAETTGLKADAVKVWRHKYTGQAVCADVAIGPTEGGFPGHTFAEPSV